MRFLADENMPLPSIEALRAASYDVASISQESPGISDMGILERAQKENRLVLTFDRDFGELIFARGASGLPGVVFCRFILRAPIETADILQQLIAHPDLQLAGFYTVVEREHIRQRALPKILPAE